MLSDMLQSRVGLKNLRTQGVTEVEPIQQIYVVSVKATPDGTV